MCAGTGAANNLVRSLRAGDGSLRIVGCHSDQFFLKKSSADRNYLLPSARHPKFGDALRGLVERERVGVVIPTTDDDVALVSGLRKTLRSRVFLPHPDTIALCQDKYALAQALGSAGVPVPATWAIGDRGDVSALFRTDGTPPRLWCRARRGTGSVAALPVTTAAQLLAWVSYWEDMRGLPSTEFMISEYLPGRDFACQTLWQNGRPVLAKTSERLSYFGGRGTPSGTSSIGGLHKMVRAPAVVEASLAAVRAIDAHATGAFSVDLKENDEGCPLVTEINVGRFLTGTSIFDLTGKHNMSLTYVRLALGEPVSISEIYDVVEDYYMVRDLYALPDIFHAASLGEGIEDARGDLAETRV